jgi:hypothetical protein
LCRYIDDLSWHDCYNPDAFELASMEINVAEDKPVKMPQRVPMRDAREAARMTPMPEDIHSRRMPSNMVPSPGSQPPPPPTQEDKD